MVLWDLFAIQDYHALHHYHFFYPIQLAETKVERGCIIEIWNFKHIVRFDKIRLFNAVNIEFGYKPLQIFSPREVTTYGREED